MSEGWVKLHRALSTNPLWLSETFTRGQAWVDMLLMANHAEGFFYIRGNKVVVSRGFIGHSKDTLAKRWSWSRDRVSRYLNDLETMGQIRQQKSSILGLVEVINYGRYQGNEATDEATDDKTDERQTRQQTDTNKNVKNKKNEKNFETLGKERATTEKVKPVASPDAIRLANGLLDCILANNPNYKHLPTTVELWSSVIDLMLRVDRRPASEVEEVIKFCQRDQFWRSNILSAGKLREKYDQLLLKSQSNPQGKTIFIT